MNNRNKLNNIILSIKNWKINKKKIKKLKITEKHKVKII